ncbi:MAG: protein kinase, partial [Bradymonadaceae bacterium]
MDQIDKYIVEGELGRGAMGVVYRAVHEFTQRTVALKVLSAEFSDSEMGAERFRREVSVSARVDDDGIIEVYDAGRIDDGFYYAMELLEGHELAGRMDDLPIDEGLALIADAAETLASCHEAGVVHRDLKPSNIFLPDEGPPTKLLDFGVASVRDAARATQTGFTLGTPFYMSPEQARDARSASPASDVWSLAIIVYELLTGNVPFDGDSAMNVMLSVVEDPPRPLPTTDVIPDRLRELLDRALAKSPEDRLGDAAAFGRQLRQIDVPSVVFPGNGPAISGHEETLGTPPSTDPDSPTTEGNLPAEAAVPKGVPANAETTPEDHDATTGRTLPAEAADSAADLPDEPYDEATDATSEGAADATPDVSSEERADATADVSSEWATDDEVTYAPTTADRSSMATVAATLAGLAVAVTGAIWYVTQSGPESASPTASAPADASAADDPPARPTARGDALQRARQSIETARTSGIASLARSRLLRAVETAPIETSPAGGGPANEDGGRAGDDGSTARGTPAEEAPSGRPANSPAPAESSGEGESPSPTDGADDR